MGKISSVVLLSIIAIGGTAHAQFDPDGFIKSWQAGVAVVAMDDRGTNGVSMDKTLLSTTLMNAWTSFDLVAKLNQLVPTLKPGAYAYNTIQSSGPVEVRAKQLAAPNSVAFRIVVPGNSTQVSVPNAAIFDLTFTVVADAVLSADEIIDGESVTHSQTSPLHLSAITAHVTIGRSPMSAIASRLRS
jgi:hypothetical protein